MGINLPKPLIAPLMSTAAILRYTLVVSMSECPTMDITFGRLTFMVKSFVMNVALKSWNLIGMIPKDLQNSLVTLAAPPRVHSCG